MPGAHQSKDNSKLTASSAKGEGAHERDLCVRRRLVRGYRDVAAGRMQSAEAACAKIRSAKGW